MSGFPMAPSEEMLALARQVRARAYAPYSGYTVGAVLKGESGKLYAGCNVENAAYPESCCAEASAIAVMVAGGEQAIAEVLVMGPGHETVTPCGGCRQRLREFAGDSVPVYLCDDAGLRRTLTFGELYPFSFDTRHVGKA